MPNRSIVDTIDIHTLDYIKDSYGKVSIKAISKNTNISIRSLEEIIRHYGFYSMYENQGLLPRNTIARAFGVKLRMVDTWASSEEFKGVFPLVKMPPSHKCKRIYKKNGVVPDLLWRWIHQNLDQVDLRKYQLYSILPEPEWLQDAIKRQETAFLPLKGNSRYTKAEETEIWSLFYEQGLTCQEIANQVGRTYFAIERKIRLMREKKWRTAN